MSATKPDRSSPVWQTRPAGFTSRAWALVTTFLPDATDTLLLRAALVAGEPAGRAWEAWCSAVGDPVRALGTDRRHVKVLVPLIAHNLRRQHIPLDPAFQTYARAAHLTETLRMSGFFRHTGHVLDLLDTRQVPHVVLKGAALAGTVYDDIALRHAHDLDILVPEGRTSDAGAVLEANGFARTTPVGADHHHWPPLSNAAGFSVDLHRRFRNQYPRFAAAGVFERSIAVTIAGRATRVPSLPDLLLHVCVHALACVASNLRWAADAWVIATRMTPADWARAEAIAESYGLALPAALALGYLQHNVGPIVPSGVLTSLAAQAAVSGPRERDAAAFSARASLPLDLPGILALPGGWRARADQLLWRVFPPPRHLIWMHGVSRPWMVPFYYPYRLLKAARRL